MPFFTGANQEGFRRLADQLRHLNANMQNPVTKVNPPPQIGSLNFNAAASPATSSISSSSVPVKYLRIQNLSTTAALTCLVLANGAQFASIAQGVGTSGNIFELRGDIDLSQITVQGNGSPCTVGVYYEVGDSTKARLSIPAPSGGSNQPSGGNVQSPSPPASMPTPSSTPSPQGFIPYVPPPPPSTVNLLKRTNQ